MTQSQFRSLSIGDAVFCGSIPEPVTNQYIRMIDARPISFIELDHGKPIPERMASILELGSHSKTPELRFFEQARIEQDALRHLESFYA